MSKPLVVFLPDEQKNKFRDQADAQGLPLATLSRRIHFMYLRAPAEFEQLFQRVLDEQPRAATMKRPPRRQ